MNAPAVLLYKKTESLYSLKTDTEQS